MLGTEDESSSHSFVAQIREEEDSSEEPGSDDSSASAEGDLSYRWTDNGTFRPDGTVEHRSLEVFVNGFKSLVNVGDSVFLKSDEEKIRGRKFHGNNKGVYHGSAQKSGEPTDFVARIEQMWEDPPDGIETSKEVRMKIRARWYFKKSDVEGLQGNFEGPVSRQQLVSKMTSRDLVLSDQADDNDVLTIVGKCTVLQRRPAQDLEPIPSLPSGTFVCRYGVCFSSAPGTVLLTSYAEENDDWPPIDNEETSNGFKRHAEQEDLPRKRVRQQYDLKNTADVEIDAPPASIEQTASTDQSYDLEKSSPNNDSEDSTSRLNSPNSGSESDESVSRFDGAEADGITSDDEMSDDLSSTSFRSAGERPQETEGSTTVGRIHVGSDYQAVVPPFTVQTEPFSRSPRKPTLLWKRSTASDDILDDYLAKAADILNDFLKQNDLLQEDPYTLLPTEKADAKGLVEAQGRPLTMSDVSSSSSASMTRNKLTRECRVDALMHVLLENNSDTEAALKAVASSPQDVLTVWTSGEKEVFNSCFRRYSGSLRMISKQGLAGRKNFKEVVDYHYRFKIPDQFRRYQEKKRELAVRMMECIESRRYYDSLAPKYGDNSTMVDGENNGPSISTEGKKQVSDWTKTSGTELVGASEERRSGAKDLLCEVKNELGKEKMVQVASAVKSYQYRSIPEVRESLAELLQERPDLLERFMEFFPVRFR